MLSRNCGLAAGAMLSTALLLLLIAGTKAGVTVTISLVRCSPIVAALWGLTLWGEVRNAGPRARRYIACMFSLYGMGILLISCA